MSHSPEPQGGPRAAAAPWYTYGGSCRNRYLPSRHGGARCTKHQGQPPALHIIRELQAEGASLTQEAMDALRVDDREISRRQREAPARAQGPPVRAPPDDGPGRAQGWVPPPSLQARPAARALGAIDRMEADAHIDGLLDRAMRDPGSVSVVEVAVMPAAPACPRLAQSVPPQGNRRLKEEARAEADERAGELEALGDLPIYDDPWEASRASDAEDERSRRREAARELRDQGEGGQEGGLVPRLPPSPCPLPRRRRASAPSPWRVAWPATPP